jgi:hypothetical protein
VSAEVDHERLVFRCAAGGLTAPRLAFVHHVDRETLGSLRTRVDRLLTAGEGEEIPSEAQDLGHLAYRSLFPPELRDWAAGLGRPMEVHASGYRVPWEIVHDGREFWGLAHAIGRSDADQRGIPPSRSPRARVRALVIGVDPDGDLPFVEQQVEAIRRLLEPWCDVVSHAGRRTALAAVRARMSEECCAVRNCPRCWTRCPATRAPTFARS